MGASSPEVNDGCFGIHWGAMDGVGDGMFSGLGQSDGMLCVVVGKAKVHRSSHTTLPTQSVTHIWYVSPYTKCYHLNVTCYQFFRQISLHKVLLILVVTDLLGFINVTDS